jgi:5-methylcytosine-specific restriction protein A
MPTRPKHPCAYLGCVNLTEDGLYCTEHKTKANAEYNRYRRTPEEQARYRGDWVKIRNRKIAEQPLCERCAKRGRVTPAVLVHHIKFLSDGGTNDADNLMSLCNACHEAIHQRCNAS